MSIILTPFAKLLLLFYDLTGSYGVSLILFGLVIRLILFPIFLKGRKGMLSMSGLAEKQKVLQQKYARDRVKYSQELQRLYEEEGVKPSSGCLWSFLPLPFLMVLYAIVPSFRALGLSLSRTTALALSARSAVSSSPFQRRVRSSRSRSTANASALPRSACCVSQSAQVGIVVCLNSA